MGARSSTSGNEEQLEDVIIGKDDAHVLGAGTYGKVYAGVRGSNNQKVAVKVSRKYRKEVDINQFLKEAELLLEKIPPHENIIKVYDVKRKECVVKGVQMVDFWLITELCVFGNLKEYAQQRDLGDMSKVELMHQSSRGVQHLHNCKPESVAHRDIKPENMLVTGSEDKPIIKLCDFGCARTVMRADDRSVTMKSRVGTPNYFAPEQTELQGEEYSYNKTTDNFSLGVSFLALLEASKGEPMIPRTVNGKSLGEVMWEHRDRPFTLPIDKPTDGALMTAIKTIVKSMIQFKPSDRLSIDEVVDRLAILGEPGSDLADRLSKLREQEEVLLAINKRSLWMREGSSWKQLPDMPVEHHDRYVCYCGVPGGIIAVGGMGDDNTVSSICHHFSLATRCWRRLPDMPTAKALASAAVLGSLMLVFGGSDKDGNALDVCEIFSLTGEQWMCVFMSRPLSLPLVAETEGKVFVIPQEVPSSRVQMTQYEPTTDTAVRCRGSELPRHVQNTQGACLVAAPDETLYLLGGRQQLAAQYNSATHKLVQLQARPAARYDHHGCCAVVHRSKIVLCGGSPEGNDMVQTYDLHTHQWNVADFKLPFAFSQYQSHVSVVHQ